MVKDKNDQQEELEEEQQKIEEAESSLDKEVENLKNKIEDVENRYKRALADYQNLQRRVEEEKISWIQSANKDLILILLPVLDTLIMANKHLNDQGITLTIQQFLGAFAQVGIKQIPHTVGLKFDPNLMECITTEEGEDGKVLEVLKEGYKLYDKVLRPAQVKVGKSELKN